MAEVEFNNIEDESKVKIVDGGENKEPGGGLRKPTQEEIDYYKIHRIVVMVLFAIVVLVLLLVVVIMIATIDRCEAMPVEEELPWWKSGIIYNIYPRSFKDSIKQDGVGDFQGIIEKLDYLKTLGVNILYLNSVFNVDQNDAVVDFKQTNPDYGTLKQFEKLVEAVHQKDLKVIIDFIPNDSSNQHKWFTDSLNVNSSKHNWYIWRDTANNDSCWTKENTTKNFYFNTCKNGTAHLNWNNVDVEKELQSVLGFWLDKGVDGFRVVSVAKLFDNLKSSGNDMQKIHTTVNKWHNYTTKQNADSVLIGGSQAKYYGTEDKPEFNIVINLKLVPEKHQDTKQFYSAKKFQELIDSYIKSVPVGKWPNWALSDHRRVASNVSPKLAKSLTVLLLTLPGTPIMFYGDEIGMQDVGNSGIANKAPMQWSSAKHVGFSDQDALWFGPVGNGSIVNAEDDQYGMKAFFKKVAKFRAVNQLALLSGHLANFTVIEKDYVLAYTLKSELIIAINFDSSSQTVDLSKVGGGAKEGELSLSTSESKGKDKVELSKVTIEGEHAAVITVL